MKNIVIISTLVAILLVGGVVFIFYQNRSDIITEVISSPQAYRTPSVSPSPSLSKPPTTNLVSSEVNLAVPFTAQAPHQNWNQPYQDFCEEASILMAVQYVKGELIPNADFADSKMLAIMDFEIKKFGYHRDTKIDEVAIVFREFYGIKAIKIVYDPTVEDIKKALVEKRAIVIPVAGRQLYNPYFTPPGPLYHMLVIKGYTKEGNFITNDPGTRRGADFIYAPDVLMNAIHDWNGGDVDNGRKVVLVVG